MTGRALAFGVLALTGLLLGCNSSKDGAGKGTSASGLELRIKAPDSLDANVQPGPGDNKDKEVFDVTLTVKNQNAMVYQGEVRQLPVATFVIKSEATGKVIFETSAGAAVTQSVRIDKGETKSYSETVTIEDIRPYAGQTLIVTGTFKPSGEKATKTIKVNRID